MNRPNFPACPFYSLEGIRLRFFPSRSIRWVRGQAKAGAFGDLVRDGGGWLVPEAGVMSYFERHRVAAAEVCETAARTGQIANLIQLRG